MLQSSLFIEVSQGLLASAQIDLLWGFLVPRVRYGSLVCLPHPLEHEQFSRAWHEPVMLIYARGSRMMPACDLCLRHRGKAVRCPAIAWSNVPHKMLSCDHMSPPERA